MLRTTDLTAAPRGWPLPVRPVVTEAAGEHRAPRWLVATAASALALGLVLSVWYARTREPWWDEGLYADLARQFARSGVLRSPLLGPVGSFGFGDMPATNERAYWTTPLYPVVVGLWLRSAGEGLLHMRLLSVALAVVLVASWGDVVRRLTHSPTVAWISVALMALNTHVIWGASIARPEALASGLAMIGAALYLRWREAHLSRAVAAMTALVAAGSLAHPLAVVEGVAFAAVALAADWRRLRPRHVLTTMAVGTVVVSPWLLYIAQDPALFRAQWPANGRAIGGRSRSAGLVDPLGAMISDFRDRYVFHHGWGASGTEHMAFVQLVVVGLALFVGVFAPAVRRQRGWRPLALLAGCSWGALAILDGSRYSQYLLHVFPAYLAFAALTVCVMVRRGWTARAAGLVLVAGLTLPGVAWAGNLARRNLYERHYRPVAELVRERQRAGASVVGGSELAFELGFDPLRLRDDMELRTPADVYVQNQFYDWSTPGHPVHTILARDYQLVHRSESYRVYVRRGAPPASMRAASGSASTSVTGDRT